MKITGGHRFGGRVLPSPKDNVRYPLRPTTGKLREAVFSMLQASGQHYPCFLDGFAGTGIMGFEALSRNLVARVVALESSPLRIKEIAHAAKLLELNQSEYCYALTPVERYLQRKRPDTQPAFDLVFFDPPYGRYDMNTFIIQLFKNDWINLENQHCQILIEQGRDDMALTIPDEETNKETFAGWTLSTRHYGDSRLDCLRMG